ncbi:MAG TPA: ATP-binding protein [Chroococcales cyanobacterium]
MIKSALSKPPQPSTNWISQVIRRLSISQKISCGYALTLSIAVLGTTAGFIVGDRYQQQARVKENDALEEIRHLHRLQTYLLLAQSQQHHFANSQYELGHLKKDYAELYEYLVEFKQVWSEFKSSYTNLENAKSQESSAEIKAFHRLVQNYDRFLEEYLWQTEVVLKQINSSNLKSQEAEAGRRRLLSLNNTAWHAKLESYIDDINELIDIVDDEYEQASTNGIAADALRVRIIATSISLSVILAIFLAIYTSRAIAQPLQSTTQVAQRVTQEKNFDLQAPVTTDDEVGALTASLNLLVLQVKQLLEEQKASNQAQLMQSEKMSSLGRMMAGVAHEINDPVNFIYGNSLHAIDYVNKIIALLETYAAEIPNPPQAVQSKLEEYEFDFLKQDLPKVLQSMKLGAERTAEISVSLKDFSRLDQAIAHPVDLHACIDSTLLILSTRIKRKIAVNRNYGNIPEIKGYAGLLYQVFMNLLGNAIDALAQQTSSNKQITIVTERQDEQWVMIKIADNGIGMPPEHQAKVFDAFFSTKPRGMGTGLGLAITHEIIVEKHGGKITCTSEVGVGTEFAIALPITQQPLAKSGVERKQLISTSRIARS